MRSPGILVSLALALPQAFALFATAASLSGLHPSLRSRHALCLAAGDVIRVIADVKVKGGLNANGMTGVVTKVFGEGDDACDDTWGACCDLAWGEPTLTVSLNRPHTGYFEFRELKLVARDEAAVKAFEASECERWLAVYDEEWPGTPQELYEGDLVEVVRDVPIKGIESTLGMVGTVVNVWMECETDAACCCNELATAPVTVQFDLTPQIAEAAGEGSEILVGYFCEEEVEVVQPQKIAEQPVRLR